MTVGLNPRGESAVRYCSFPPDLLTDSRYRFSGLLRGELGRVGLLLVVMMVPSGCRRRRLIPVCDR
jgi:hypothetical protein